MGPAGVHGGWSVHGGRVCTVAGARCVVGGGGLRGVVGGGV